MCVLTLDVKHCSDMMYRNKETTWYPAKETDFKFLKGMTSHLFMHLKLSRSSNTETSQARIDMFCINI